MRVILDKGCLQVLRELALLDGPRETLYDCMTLAISQIMGAPISLMSMVGGEFQFFKSEHGVPDIRQTPLEDAYCKHVVANNAPLIVNDSLNYFSFEGQAG
jgi:hypothetical protein